jgi:hypothetical protein
MYKVLTIFEPTILCPVSEDDDRYAAPQGAGWLKSSFFLKKLPPYTLAGFDLTIHSSNHLGGRLRR